MGKKVRIKDIAQKAKVSVGTVDRVLHGRGEVSTETKTKVLAIVNEMGYVPNLVAKSLGSKKALTLAILLPVADSEHAYWQMPMAGIQKAANELKDFNAKFRVVQFDPNSSASFVKAFEEMIKEAPDGIILTPVFESLPFDISLKCKEAGIPLLSLEINLKSDDSIGYFGQDARGSGRLAGKLMEQIMAPESALLLLNITRKMTLTPHLRRRSQGFIDYFSQSVFHKNIQVKSLSLNIPDVVVLRETLENEFSHGSNLQGIYVTSSQVHRVAACLQAMGRDDVLLVGHDLLDENLHFLDEGVIDFLIAHKPEENAYRCVMAMFNQLNGMKDVPKVNLSSIDIIMKENIDYYKNKR